MVGLRFIVRVLEFILATGILAILAIAVFYAVSWAIRLTWEAFERNYHDQAAWVRTKLPRRHKSRTVEKMVDDLSEADREQLLEELLKKR